MAGWTFPFFNGGVQTVISAQLAVRAGITCIKNEEISGAVPPGTYRPTFEIGTNLSQMFKPLIGLIVLPKVFNWDLETNEIFFIASYKANFSSSVKYLDDPLNSFFDTLRFVKFFKLNFNYYCNFLCPK